MSEDLRFPIGRFDPDNIAPAAESIRVIAELPAKLHAAAGGLTDDRLDTPYRPEGWTLRQTVHHIPDNPVNALCRFKLALTEETPTIRPYAEGLWAELADSRMPVAPSLAIIEGVHARWAELLRSLSESDLKRKLNHPESGVWELGSMLAMYAWHSEHHLAHITRTCERNGW